MKGKINTLDLDKNIEIKEFLSIGESILECLQTIIQHRKEERILLNRVIKLLGKKG